MSDNHTTPCVHTKLVRDMMVGVERKIDALSESVTNHLMHRLPPSVMIAIAALTALVGGLMALLGHAMFN